MDLEPSVFPRAPDATDAAPSTSAGAQIIDTTGVEVVETVEVVLWVPPANMNGAPAKRLVSARPVPYASTLRHIA